MLFKNMKIAFCTQNTVQSILKYHMQTDKYNSSCIYQMKCLDCPRMHIRQTGSTFNIRYAEHIHAIRSNNSDSRYSNYIPNKFLLSLTDTAPHIVCLSEHHLRSDEIENINFNINININFN
jgi:hypothetical protein